MIDNTRNSFAMPRVTNNQVVRQLHGTEQQMQQKTEQRENMNCHQQQQRNLPGQPHVVQKTEPLRQKHS